MTQTGEDGRATNYISAAKASKMRALTGTGYPQREGIEKLALNIPVSCSIEVCRPWFMAMCHECCIE